ncbi:hypothetical protein BP5796_11740 [Coleophoma crateriformis]|uniref:Uncharacterized protein n=1 Tax=Coleophoma crateriformis TaxID=565419 RepID=A0A3D8QFD6_9HELO|nr:hypothetical protein BP5796_11740 [Coleophoma crateriformis]
MAATPSHLIPSPVPETEGTLPNTSSTRRGQQASAPLPSAQRHSNVGTRHTDAAWLWGSEGGNTGVLPSMKKKKGRERRKGSEESAAKAKRKKATDMQAIIIIEATDVRLRRRTTSDAFNRVDAPPPPGPARQVDQAVSPRTLAVDRAGATSQP